MTTTSKLNENHKSILFKHTIAHEFADIHPELSASAHVQYRHGILDSDYSIPKSHAEQHPHCPKCGSMRRNIHTSSRSKRAIKVAKKKTRRRLNDVNKSTPNTAADTLRNHIIAHCQTCQFVYTLPGCTTSAISDYEARKRKYIDDLSYDPTSILEEMSSGGSASSSRAPSPMPLPVSQPPKKKKKNKHPSSLQELLQRNKMREMDKSSRSNSQSNNSSQANTPSSGLGAFLSSYD
ncbi:hypothetical protein E3P99_01709 [Wallemia hederae]|uniref:Uncharacterized protein n=1 Tax=Wallemia hederae TaxID=1540922 RepID=A0A4T0FRE2_9BASI|nr:hypothetical protein E3P99_01709 [Wallemia hederae]